jgi:hypothetical protein
MVHAMRPPPSTPVSSRLVWFVDTLASSSCFLAPHKLPLQFRLNTQVAFPTVRNQGPVVQGHARTLKRSQRCLSCTNGDQNFAETVDTIWARISTPVPLLSIGNRIHTRQASTWNALGWIFWWVNGDPDATGSRRCLGTPVAAECALPHETSPSDQTETQETGT